MTNDDHEFGSNMHVLRTRQEAIDAAHDARQLFESMYLASVHIELDGRIAAKWWPLTAYPRGT
jgi:hypothetical protein